MPRALRSARAPLPRSRPRPASRRGPFIILAARVYAPIARRLVQGATRALRAAGVPPDRIRVIQVPGAFELPVAAARAADARPRPAAVIALGALIRGQTPQYAVLASAVAHGLTAVAVQTRIPVTCGVIVAETAAQAAARAGGAEGNRGAEAANAALAVLDI